VIVGIETGGTKVVCGAAPVSTPREVALTRQFPTTTPSETIAAINGFLAEAAALGPIDAVGLASFGPVNVEPASPRYGWITGTPKLAWRDTALLDRLHLDGAPVAVLSDVSGAALGELHWGAGVGWSSIGYATFGTGVGVGLVHHGALVNGNGYPELGHILVRRHPLDDFRGVCPYHGDCLEGLASGPAVLARWGADASSLPPDVRPVAFAVLGYYIAQITALVATTIGADRMVLGGGVLKAPGLLDAARAALDGVTGGPGAGNAVRRDAAELMVLPALGDRSGLLGAIAAGLDAYGASGRGR
jgi:fructokinase